MKATLFFFIGIPMTTRILYITPGEGFFLFFGLIIFSFVVIAIFDHSPNRVEENKAIMKEFKQRYSKQDNYELLRSLDIEEINRRLLWQEKMQIYDYTAETAKKLYNLKEELRNCKSEERKQQIIKEYDRILKNKYF